MNAEHEKAKKDFITQKKMSESHLRATSTIHAQQIKAHRNEYGSLPLTRSVVSCTPCFLALFPLFQ